MKTPIRDPKFCNASTSQIVKIIEPGASINTYRFFSGAIELSLSRYDFDINSHTQRPAIAEFWYCLFENPELLYHKIQYKDFIPKTDMQFAILQKTFLDYKDPYFRAALFFMLTTCSDLGRPSCGKFDKTKMTAVVLNRLKSFKKPKNFNLHYGDNSYQQIFSNKIIGDYILFPNLIFNYNLFDYGKSSSFDSQIVNHSFLRDLLSKQKKTILIYNNHPALLKFFNKFNITLVDKYGNISNDSTNYEEAIVTNF